MEYVRGRIFRDAQMIHLSSSERFAAFNSMNSVLSKLHKVDFKQLGLSDFGRKDNYCKRIVRRVIRLKY